MPMSILAAGLGVGVSVRSCSVVVFFFSSRRRHTRCSRDWSSDVCSSDLYFLNNFIGVEGDVVFQPEYTVTPPGGTANTLQPLIAGASLVVNALRAPRLTVYALGGYSLLDFGTRAPYHFTDNALHGGAGIRVFLTNRIALRVEGRAIITPSTKSAFGFQSVTHYLGTAGL